MGYEFFDPAAKSCAGRIEEIQRSFCSEHAATFSVSEGTSKLGFAIATSGLSPINGMRHVPEADTNGWYLWCGEEASDKPDFFQPLHTQHVYDKYPELIKLLGLPPGYRFLLSGEYLDIWYDASLLAIDPSKPNSEQLR